MRFGSLGLTATKLARVPHAYNYSPSALANWNAARTALLAGSGRPKVLFIGDSKTMGAGVGSTDGSTFTVGAAALSKTKKIADLLTGYGLPVSRQSVVPANGLASIAALKAYDVRLGTLTNWILSSGTFISLGGNVLQLATPNVDALAVFPEGIVDTVEVLYIRGATVGHFTIDDGGAPLVDIDGAGSNALVRVTQALSNRGAGKTINLKRTTANTNSIYIAGVIAYDSTIPAVEIVNAGRFGSKSADWIVNTNPWNPLGAIAAYAPKLTFISLGANDLANAVIDTTFGTNMQAIITAAKASGDVVLINQASGSRPAWGTQIAQAAYRAKLAALALANNCVLIDEDELFGGYTGDATKFADGIHENGAGTDIEAAAIAQLMTRDIRAPVLRTVPDSANSFYVVVRTPSGDADAIHFQRNVGSGGAGDLGNKWPEWRATGRSRLASFASDPTAPTLTFTNDPGAQDIVATSNGTVFMGSFHGLGAAGALNSETLLLDGAAFDPTTARTGNLLSVQNSTTASDGTNSFTRDMTTTVGASGGVHYKINSKSSTGTISFVYLGMVIGTGAFDEADIQLTNGGPWKPLPAFGTSQAVTGQVKLEVAAKGIRLRDTATGRAVQVTGSAVPALANYLRAEFARVTGNDRLKGYFARFTNIAALAGAEWETNAAVVATGSLEGTNLMTNGNFASGDLTGWTKASGAGTATVVGGVMNQVREAASNHRMRQSSVITAVVNDIEAFRMDVNAVSAGNFPIARVANANTLSATGAMIDQTTVLGRNIYVFQASVTTLWPGDEFSAGTAGQTADTDNYGLWKIN